MSTYDVKVVREGDDWVAHWGARSTFASSLRALDTAIRWVIVLAQDLPDDAAAGLTLNFTYDLGPSSAYLREVEAARAAAAEAALVASQWTEGTITHLRSEGYTVRDIAAIVGLSHQRVSQVMGEAAARG